MVFDLTAPDVAILVFTVKDKNVHLEDRFVAQAAISFPMLKLGVRAIPLCNTKLSPIQGARLLCEFQISPLAP
jgi:hypothetical protein